MTSDSEFVASDNHAIQLALDLTVYPNITAVLLILLETLDVNASYMQLCMITTTNVIIQEHKIACYLLKKLLTI